MEKPERTSRPRIEAQISFPHFSLRFSSADPIGSLRELNKMLNTLRAMEVAVEGGELDDPLYFRFMNLSEELRKRARGDRWWLL